MGKYKNYIVLILAVTTATLYLCGCANQTGDSPLGTDINFQNDIEFDHSEMSDVGVGSNNIPSVTETAEDIILSNETPTPEPTEIQQDQGATEILVEPLVVTPIPIQYPLPSTTPIPLDEYPAGIIEIRDNAPEGDPEVDGSLWDTYFDTWMENGCLRDFTTANYAIHSHHMAETRSVQLEENYVHWEYGVDEYFPQIYYSNQYGVDGYGNTWTLMEEEINETLYKPYGYWGIERRDGNRNNRASYQDYTIHLAEDDLLSIQYFSYSISLGAINIGSYGATFNPATGEILKLTDFITLDDTLFERLRNGEIHCQQEFVTIEYALSTLEFFLYNHNEDSPSLAYCYYIDSDTLYLLMNVPYDDIYITLEIPLGT